MKNRLSNKLIPLNFLGHGWSKFLFDATSSNIVFHDIVKNSYNNITFSISRKDYVLITKSDKFSQYKIVAVDNRDVSNLWTSIVARVGLLIGFVVGVLLCFTFSRVTLHYNISGLNNIDKEVVNDVLADYGIKLGKVNDFDNSDLENYLLQNIEGVSLVSVMKKGTTICINFKEKDEFFNNFYENLQSPYNMVITGVSVSSGFARCEIGDVVKSGDVIVEACVSEADSSRCVVLASVQGTAWWTGSVRFEKQVEVLVPTGKSKSFRQTKWAGKLIGKSTISSPYNVYKIAQSESDFLGNFLPLSFLTTTYLECEKVVVEQNLEENKEILLQESRLLTYNKLPSNIKDVTEKQKIVDMGSYYLINTYLSANVEVKSAN